MSDMMNAPSAGSADQEAEMERQKEEYSARGISLTYYDAVRKTCDLLRVLRRPPFFDILADS